MSMCTSSPGRARKTERINGEISRRSARLDEQALSALVSLMDASQTRGRQILSDTITTEAARVGDAVEVKGLAGKPAKHGQIVEVLGAGEHVHFRVRWDDEHESLLYPTEGAAILHRPAHDTAV
jgi:hypothetical protein